MKGAGKNADWYISKVIIKNWPETFGLIILIDICTLINDNQRAKFREFLYALYSHKLNQKPTPKKGGPPK